jgi:hypothetical protein
VDACVQGLPMMDYQPGRRTLKRRLASVAYRSRIGWLDRLNENVDFVDRVPPLFTAAQAVADPLALYRHVNSVTVGNIPIDYLEFGVYQGWSIQQWANLNTHPDSRFVGFDTFTGLPEDWNELRKAGAFNVNGNLPPATDARVSFVAGLFQHTLVDFLRNFHFRNQLIIHIDCDLYSSTLFCLATLDRHMPPGTVVMFDEFYDVLHEFAAYRDYSDSFMRTWQGLCYTPEYVQVALRLT